jgi:hypothetical protein
MNVEGSGLEDEIISKPAASVLFRRELRLEFTIL